MSNAIAAMNTLLQIGDGGSPTETFTTIAEVRDITGPSMSVQIEDVTSHSTGNPWREKLATLLDAGQISFDLSFVPQSATHSYSTGLLKDFVNRVKRNFQLVLTDAGTTTWKFAAYVASFDMGMPVDGVLNASITLELTEQPTFE